ncbi:MAG: hypothetical protein WD691_06595 [Acidimicrobiales bacterium]
MTTVVAPRRRPPIVAVVVYTLGIMLHGKRWVGLALPCATAVLFGLLARALESSPSEDFAQVASTALFGLVLPVACLVIGDSALGSEIRSGSFAFTWLSPVPAWQIALGRWLGGAIIGGGMLAVAFALSAVVAGAAESADEAAVAAAFGTMAYIAVFLAIGCLVRRAAAWSLAYVFLVERLLGAALAGIAQISPGWEARAVFVELANGPTELFRDDIPQGSAAIVRLVAITVVALGLASWRLSHLRLSGSTD